MRTLQTITIVFFFVLSNTSWAENSRCLDGPLKSLESYRILVSEKGAYSELELIRLNQEKIALKASEQGLGIIPINSQFSSKLYTSEALNDPGKDNGLDSTFSLTVDVVEAFKGASASLKQLDYLLAKQKVKRAQAKLKVESIKALLELSASKELESIYLNRKQLLEQKVEYYQINQQLGGTWSGDLLEAESRLLEVDNKIDALLIKRSQTLMGLANSGPELFAVVPILGGLKILPLTCLVSDDKNVALAQLELEIARKRLVQLDADNGYRVDGFWNVTSERDANGSSPLNKSTIGIDLTIPLFDGGQRNAQREQFKANIDQAELSYRESVRQARVSLIDWSNREDILLKTLEANALKFSKQQNELVGMMERRNLGDSVFIEMTDLAQQMTLLQESMIGLQKDLYFAWLSAAQPYWIDD